MNEDTDIAFLAASLDKSMQSMMKGGDIPYRRTDFRRFLNGPQPPQNQYQHPQQQYPQQQYRQPPPQQPQYTQHPIYEQQDYPNIPEGIIPPSNAPLAMLPQQYAQHYAPQGNIPQGSYVAQMDGFSIPDYSGQKQYLEDEGEFRKALITEIKSQKTTIKKLTKDIAALKMSIEQLVLHLNPTSTTEENPDANSDQS